MTMPAKHGLTALTEKEKQALRLLVRGYDAKAIARALDLSVHTINDRLRYARRKVAVPSSREAARLLFEAESAAGLSHPEAVGHTEIGDAHPASVADAADAPMVGAGLPHRRPWIVTGVVSMALGLLLGALVASPQLALPTSQVPSAPVEAPDARIVETARQWLALVDQARWEDSYRATGASFRQLNTAQTWAEASRQARVPLGEMISRTFVSQEDLPAPPHGYEVVKFRTRFANRSEAIETVALNR